MLNQHLQFDAIPYPVVLVKRSGQVAYVNQSAVEFSAMHEKDLLAMPVHDVFHPKNLLFEDCPLCEYLKCQNDSASQNTYYEDRAAWYRISFSPMSIDSENDGVLQMFVANTGNDPASERKSDSEISIHALLVNMPVIYYRIDQHESIREIVGLALSKLDLNGEDPTAMKAHDVFSTLKGKYDTIRRHGRYFFESQHVTKQEDVWLFHYVYSESEGGEILGFALDVTSMKRAQRATLKLSVDKQNLARRMLQMQEDVRFEVARDLHDEFGQTITAIRLIASSMLNAENVGVDFYRQNAEGISDIANKMYDAAHELMYRLRPMVLDNLGLKEALRSCIQGSRLSQVGVNVQLSVEGEVESMDKLVQLTLYRIVQEALTNAAKYSRASKVQVRVERKQIFLNAISQTDMLELQIADDGVGIETVDHKLVNKNGMGILGLQERVQALGGVLNFSSGVNEGLVLSVRINLKTSKFTHVE